MRTVVIGLLLAGAVACGAPEGGQTVQVPPAASDEEPHRCASAIEGVQLAEVELGLGDSATTVGAAFGPRRASRVALLLHQNGPFGWCGWARWAGVAAERGVASLAFDLCGHGESRCGERLEVDPASQVAAVLDSLDQHFPEVRDVVLVGASLGGHLTVRAVAAGAPVAAWADVSGPVVWDGVDLLRLAAPVADRGLPGLVVSSRSDGVAEFSRSRRLAARTCARFVAGGPGHGYELLLTLDGDLARAGQTLAAFVAGAR